MMIAVGLAITVTSAAVAVEAGAATKAQYGRTCDAAWTGKRNTKTYSSYKRHCIRAAIAATKAAVKAGNNQNASADHGRAVAACRAQFPAPRNTKTKRKMFKACIAAASSAQKQYGGRPLHATLAGSPTTDPDGTGSADLTLNQGHGQICFSVTWMNLDPVTGVQVQKLADSSVVATLTDDFTDGNGKGCVNGVDKKTIMALRQHPEQYAVVVQVGDPATTAITGTLHK